MLSCAERLLPYGSAWNPRGKAVIVLVPTGDPPSLRFGHPDVTTDDTAFPCWGTMRVRPRFPGSRSRPRCRSVPVHLPEATSGYPLGCSPQRSKEERSTREGGFPCRSVGRSAPAASHRNANTASEPASCRSCPTAHSREREPNAPRSAPPPASNQRQRQPRRCRCAPPARTPPNRQCR